MKNHLKILITMCIMALLVPITFYAQNATSAPETPNVKKHSLGMGAGFTTGYGLSYRYKPKELGMQINFAPYKTKTYEQYSLGFTFLYELVKFKETSLYVYEGNHYLYSRDKEFMKSTYDPNTGMYNNETITVTQSYMNNGIGFGLSVLAGGVVSFDFMAGYAFYENFTQINLTGEVAIYYKF